MRQRSIISLVAFLSLLIPSFVQADGMVIAPPDFWVQETAQKAVIFHEKGVETLVLSTSFQGDAKDFAWIVPTPTKPEISKGTQEVFTNLQRLTQNVGHRDVPTYGLGGVQIENVGGTGVTVIEEKQVDYYDFAVLTATDKDALKNWLQEKGYNYPAEASYLFQEYINNNWYFVAMRVNAESLGFTNVSQQLRQGGATPVVLKFATERIVYPLRISTIMDSTPTPTPDLPPTTSPEIPVGTFVTGEFNQALSVSSGSEPVYSVGTSFPNKEGAISAHIKLQNTSNDYRSIVALHDSSNANRMQFRLAKDTNGTFMQFVQYPETGDFVAWRSAKSVNIVPGVFYHVAVTWSADKQPQFYLNGDAVTTVAAYGETSWFGKDPTANSKLVIGGLSFGSDSLNGEIDDVVIYNRPVTNGGIMNLHNVAAGNLGEAQGLKNAVFYANFDNVTTAVDGNGNAITQLQSFGGPKVTQKVLPTTIRTTPTQPLTLYVIADERKDATDFTTLYANWFTKGTIRDLAFASDGDPLLAADSKKMFVTVLTRTIASKQVLDDVFFRKATSQTVMGQAPDGTSTSEQQLGFWLFLGGTMFVTILMAIFLLLWSRKPRTPAALMTPASIIANVPPPPSPFPPVKK